MNAPADCTRYLIAGPTRSGTTAVHLLLCGHPQVAALVGELAFSRLAAGLGGFTVRGYVTEEEERHGRAALFDAVTGVSRTASTRALGAKTTVNSAAAATRLATVLESYLPSVKIVLLVRRDLVAHYYSRSALKHTGVAHSWSAGDGSRLPSRVDRWLLAKSALATAAVYDVLRQVRGFTDCLEIEYEDFARDNLACYRRVLGFLGLDYVEPHWHHARKLHQRPETSIPRYQELTAYVGALLERSAAGTLPPHYLYGLKAYARARTLLRVPKGRR